MRYPLWATPQRRAWLVELVALGLEGSCYRKETPCPIMARFNQAIRDRIGEPNGPQWVMRAALAAPKALAQFSIPELYHLAPWAVTELKGHWKAQDRAERARQWQREHRRLHWWQMCSW